MKDIQKQIGQLAREYRERMGLTQQELSKKLGYSTPQFVSIYERGLAGIPNKTLGQLIRILGIPEKKILKILLDSYKNELTQEISIGKKSSISS